MTPEQSSVTPNWLADKLREELRPATAPDRLWARIQAPAAASRAETGPTRFLWPAIALLMLLASADLLWEFSKARGSLRQFAQPDPSTIASLASAADACDIYSNDPVRLRQWVKSHSGIEIALPDHPPSVKVVGARVVNLRGTLVASLKYEAISGSPEKDRTVVIWKGNPGKKPHTASNRMAGTEMVSWTQGETVFAAEGSSAREACLLCHPEGTHGI